MSDSDVQHSIERAEKTDEPAIAGDQTVGHNVNGLWHQRDGFSRHHEANYRSPSFQPIRAERVLHRFELLFQRHRVRARTGLVLVNIRGKHYSFLPEERPTMGELLWTGRGMLYEVDMGLHWTSFGFDLPSREEAFPFHTGVDVEWRVIDPAQVVRDGVKDVREAISPALQHRLSVVTRQFYVEDAAIAEAKALESLIDHPIGGEYGLRSRVFLRMQMDEPTVKYASAVREVRRDVHLEHETQVLRLLREASTTTLIAKRVERYRAIILAGDYDQFALQLAQNPNEAPAVIQMLRDERHDNRRNVTDFVTHLLDSGAIDRYEINDQVRAALDWLKEATDTVLRGPEQSAIIRGSRDSDAPSSTNMPESDLPEPSRVDTMRPPEDAPT